MNIKTLAQAALATIIINHAESVVTVVANGKSAQAVSDTKTVDADLQDEGERGATAGTARMNADTIGAVTQGQPITVAGVAAFAMQVKTDPAGAITTIHYKLQEQK